MNNPILKVNNLKTYFPVYGGPFSTLQGYVHAVDDVSFSVMKGETLGLVGESGCGKSTLMQSILRLIPVSSGEVFFEDKNLLTLSRRDLQKIRKEFQIIYQDPFSSLNPRMKIGDIVEEPLIVHGFKNERERKELVIQVLHDVGLDQSAVDRYPHEFSGGQRQRVCIAKALILKPKLILCDEPVSALDVSIQSQILNLLSRMKEKYGLTYIFVSHSLNTVKFLSDRVCVMYLGKIVEIADKHDFYDNPLHPYSKALLSAVPIPDPKIKRERIILDGDIASPKDLPKGCRFSTRCFNCIPRCQIEEPELKEITPGHSCACFRMEEFQ